jgi:hypothetical protein
VQAKDHLFVARGIFDTGADGVMVRPLAPSEGYYETRFPEGMFATFG